MNMSKALNAISKEIYAHAHISQQTLNRNVGKALQVAPVMAEIAQVLQANKCRCHVHLAGVPALYIPITYSHESFGQVLLMLRDWLDKRGARASMARHNSNRCMRIDLTPDHPAFRPQEPMVIDIVFREPS